MIRAVSTLADGSRVGARQQPDAPTAPDSLAFNTCLTQAIAPEDSGSESDSTGPVTEDTSEPEVTLDGQTILESADWLAALTLAQTVVVGQGVGLAPKAPDASTLGAGAPGVPSSHLMVQDGMPVRSTQATASSVTFLVKATNGEPDASPSQSVNPVTLSPELTPGFLAERPVNSATSSGKPGHPGTLPVDSGDPAVVATSTLLGGPSGSPRPPTNILEGATGATSESRNPTLPAGAAILAETQREASGVAGPTPYRAEEMADYPGTVAGTESDQALSDGKSRWRAALAGAQGQTPGGESREQETSIQMQALGLTPDVTTAPTLREVSAERGFAPEVVGEAAQPPSARSVGDQVVAHASLFGAGRGKGVRIHLKPPELGSLDLRLVVESGQVTLRVATETAAARELIEAAWPVLRDGLAERGLHAQRLVVEEGVSVGGDAFASPGQGDSPTRQPKDAYVPEPITSPAVRMPRSSEGESGRPVGLIDYRV